MKTAPFLFSLWHNAILLFSLGKIPSLKVSQGNLVAYLHSFDDSVSTLLGVQPLVPGRCAVHALALCLSCDLADHHVFSFFPGVPPASPLHCNSRQVDSCVSKYLPNHCCFKLL